MSIRWSFSARGLSRLYVLKLIHHRRKTGGVFRFTAAPCRLYVLKLIHHRRKTGGVYRSTAAPGGSISVSYLNRDVAASAVDGNDLAGDVVGTVQEESHSLCDVVGPAGQTHRDLVVQFVGHIGVVVFVQ